MDLDALDELPASWRVRLAGKTIIPVAAGMSGARVFRVTADNEIEYYLKIGTGALADLVRREIERTEWLASVGIRVPKVLANFAQGNVVAMAMTALGEQNAECLGEADWRPAVAAIARAVAHLHSLPLAICPFDEMLEIRLSRAHKLMCSDAIDPDGFDERNAGLTPENLYDRLTSNIPCHEDCVVTHGDATLSNLVLGDDGQVGFVDCSHCGRADRYVDLALLVGEIGDRLGIEARNTFIAAYGDLRWEEKKADFYRDLYEFF